MKVVLHQAEGWWMIIVSNKRIRGRCLLFAIVVLLSAVLLMQNPVQFQKHMKPMDINALTIEQVPNTQQKEKKQRQLEFVHIPKTGGTAIEAIANDGNLSWSICHFKSGIIGQIHCNNTEAKNKQLLHWWRKKGNIPWWHVPPTHIRAFYKGIDPYVDANLFAVVRNPYMRIISEYKMIVDSQRRQRKKLLGDEHLNWFINQTLSEFKSKMDPGNPSEGIEGNNIYYSYYGHLIPQYDFVYDKNNQRRVIEHVLFYEHLQTDFSNLMAQYNILLELPNTTVLPNHRFIDRKLGISNINIENMLLIEDVYKDDFVEFGYEMHSSKWENK